MDLVPFRRRPGPGLTRLQDEMNDLFSRFFGGWSLPMVAQGTAWPALDVAEREDSVIVKAELPGMKPDDINVSVQGNTLSITGEKKEETEESREGYYHCERHFGSFRRDLVLPTDVDPENVEAASKEGVLTITMPKTAAAKAKAVKVKG